MSSTDAFDPAHHPAWCDPAHCTAPPAGRLPLGAAGGAHRSRIVPAGLDAAARGEQGPVHAQLLQSLRPDAAVFLVWLIGREQVGQVRLEDAGALAWLIADGLAVLNGHDQPDEHPGGPEEAGQSDQPEW